VGAMSEPPPEPNTDFDFREPPMTQEAGEETDEGGMVAGEEVDDNPAGMGMNAGNAAPDKEGEGCDQSSMTNGERTAHLLGVLLVGLLTLRRRQRVV